jgi:predicted nucleic acid-binding protein
LIDTNIIISFLFPTDKSERAREILETSNGPVTTLSVLEEAAYVGLSLIYNCHGYKLRNQLRKEIKETAKIFLERLRSFIIELGIKLLPLPNDLDLLLDSVAIYRLLPNDAAIAAACRYYEIERIATFDSDFDRVTFLKVIGSS